MRKYFIIALFSFVYSINCKGTICDYLTTQSINTRVKISYDTLIVTLAAMDFSYYHNRPVDTLLSYLPAGIVDMKIRGWHNLRRADVLYVSYPNNVFVAIFVKKFHYMNPNGSGNNPPNQNWDINLFKKEDIIYVVVYNGTVCINGCQYQYQ